MTDFRKIYEWISDQAGWSMYSRLSVVLDFIEEKGLGIDFTDFAAKRANDEAFITEEED